MLPKPGAAAGQESRRAVKPQRLALEKLLKVVPGRGIEGTQAQVVADKVLMFGNGLAPLGVGVDRVRGKSQLQGGEAQDFAVDLQRRLPGEAPEDADEGNLIGEAQSVVGPTSLGDLVPVSLEEAAVADQAGARHVGVDDRHDVSGRNARLDKSVPEPKRSQFLILQV